MYYVSTKGGGSVAVGVGGHTLYLERETNPKITHIEFELL